MPRFRSRVLLFVLFLYAATLGVAIAAPFVNHKAMSLICTSSGFKLVGQADDAASEAAHGSHLLDCPLCASAGLTPVFPLQDALAPPHALSYALRAIPAATLAVIVGAPLPARGPPARR